MITFEAIDDPKKGAKIVAKIEGVKGAMTITPRDVLTAIESGQRAVNVCNRKIKLFNRDKGLGK